MPPAPVRFGAVSVSVLVVLEFVPESVLDSPFWVDEFENSLRVKLLQLR